MTILSGQSIHVTRGSARLVTDASLELQTGELVVLLGPNGAGKTSLLRALIGLDDRAQGQVHLAGQDIRTLSPNARARTLSYLPQIRPLAWPNCVRDIVALGRFAYGGPLGRLTEEDEAAVAKALRACGLDGLADRRADTLSGGEMARVHFARTLAAQTPLLIADEPVAALDPRHAFSVMDLVQAFVEDGGGALVVLHDIALAARYATRLVWMDAGRIVADGPTEQTLTPRRLADIYGVKAQVDGRRVFLEGPQ